jgi:hypothetical protein
MRKRIANADTYLSETIDSADGQTRYIECRRCGEKREFKLPIVIDAFVTIVAAFNSVHSKCPKPDPRKEMA